MGSVIFSGFAGCYFLPVRPAVLIFCLDGEKTSQKFEKVWEGSNKTCSEIGAEILEKILG